MRCTSLRASSLGVYVTSHRRVCVHVFCVRLFPLSNLSDLRQHTHTKLNNVKTLVYIFLGLSKQVYRWVVETVLFFHQQSAHLVVDKCLKHSRVSSCG